MSNPTNDFHLWLRLPTDDLLPSQLVWSTFLWAERASWLFLDSSSLDYACRQPNRRFTREPEITVSSRTGTKETTRATLQGRTASTQWQTSSRIGHLVLLCHCVLIPLDLWKKLYLYILQENYACVEYSVIKRYNFILNIDHDILIARSHPSRNFW